MDLEGFRVLVGSLEGVRPHGVDGPVRWQLRGRLVARELDACHVVIRVPFDVRDMLVRQHPEAFSVPRRFAKHMMVVVDLTVADDGAIEDAVSSAWRLQTG